MKKFSKWLRMDGAVLIGASLILYSVFKWPEAGVGIGLLLILYGITTALLRAAASKRR